MGAQGTATLDFGAFPGSSHATVAVTGQTAIVAGSLVEAWLRPVATADHTDTEHMVETLKVFAAEIVAGTGFTIHGFNTSQQNEPVEVPPVVGQMRQASATVVGWVPLKQQADPGKQGGGGIGTRIYGAWTIAWVWN